MKYTTAYDGILFIEGTHDSAKIIKEIKVDLGNRFGSHLKSLRDVKAEMANQAKAANGNCIINFQYGQKHRIWAIDDISFWGSGKIASLPPEIYDGIISAL